MCILTIECSELFDVPWLFCDVSDSMLMDSDPLAVMSDDCIIMKLMLRIELSGHDHPVFLHGSVDSGLIWHEIAIVIDFVTNGIKMMALSEFFDVH